MKQVVSNYTYSPTANCVTLTGLNIDQDQLLLVVAPGVGRTLYNFASITGSVVAGTNTRINLTASTAGLTTTSPLVIYYDDQATAQAISGTVTANLNIQSVVGLDFVYMPPFQTSRTSTYYGGYFQRISEHIWQSNSTPEIGAGIQQLVNNTNLNQWTFRIIDGDGTADIFYFESAIGLYPSNGSSHIMLNGYAITDGNPIISNIHPQSYNSTVTVGNSVTIGSLPVQLSTTTIGGTSRLNVTLSSATTVGGAAPSYANLYGGSDGTNLRAISVDTSGRTVVTVSNFPSTQPVSLASLPSLAAGTAQIGSVTASISGTVPVSGTFWQATQPVSLASLPSLSAGTAQIGSVTASISGTVPVSGTFWQATQPVSGTVTANINGTVPVSGTFWQATQPVSGTVTAAVASTTVTVSAMPSGTLTTRFGTPTTANTAFLTSAVTNTARKYLLIQNVTTGSNVITVGVGFVPTTTQGIQLAAGAGITFESSYIPTGAVWVLSSVTASNHTILEA